MATAFTSVALPFSLMVRAARRSLPVVFSTATTVCCAVLAISVGTMLAAPREVSFQSSALEVEAFDFLDIIVRVSQPDARNPFADVSVSGNFARERGAKVHVDGFCDAGDGSLFRIRFMPADPGRHTYTVTYRQGSFERRHTGEFHVRQAKRRGVLRLDPERPEHFIWQGTGEHYFWNGTTTYYLMGWEDETVIKQAIDRLASFEINRLRVLIYGRNEDRPWGQPVKTTPEFKLYLNPWPAERPDDVKNPGFDLSRFDVSFWQKYERMLHYARERDVIISVIPFIGGQVLPTPFAAYGEDETRFYRYAVARLAAFSNVTWDLGNEHNFHREVPKWCDWLGPLIKEWDPYDHLTSAHNVIYRTPGKTWIDMQLIQRWDEGQNAFMLQERARQAATGRLIPQINEEYGYEDLWENRPGQRSAETRRRLAWEIAMAGCYQTTGETANRGVGFPPDSGGGWVSGRGDESMTMLKGYQHKVKFFTSFDWWKCDPANALAQGAMCLAEPGNLYAIYTSGQGGVQVRLEQGTYEVKGYDPSSGTWIDAPPASAPVWAGANASQNRDWAWLLRRNDALVDSAPPELVGASPGTRRNRVLVTLSEAVSTASALDVRHFQIAPGVSVTRTELDEQKPNVVELTTSELPLDTKLTLRVTGLMDRSPKANRMGVPAEAVFSIPDPSRPLVEFRFEGGEENALRNTGRTAEQAPLGILTKGQPKVTAKAPPGGGSSALDFGTKPGEFALDLGRQSLPELRGLASFTITAWVNCRDGSAGPGGNRIVTTVNNGSDGFDLVFLQDGRLQLSVNQWPDGLPTKSSAGAIPVDRTASPGNWRFFAVTYDSTLPKGHVKFYFGGPAAEAALDTAIDYSRGSVGSNAGVLTFGHFNPSIRNGHQDRMFRGLIDEVRIFGSTVNGSGALSLEEVNKVRLGAAISR